MQYKFNPFERAVGFFLISTLVGSVVLGLGLAIKKSWFEEKNYYSSYVHSASNIRVGSAVYIAGLKIGSIENVDLDHTHQIKVTYSVRKKYANNLTVGTKAHFVRPFVIGDKVLNLIQGPESKELIASGSELATIESTDLLEILNGKKIEQLVTRFDSITTHLNDLLDVSKNIALQVGEKDKVKKIVENVAFASKQLKNAPQMVQDTSKILSNLNSLSSQLKELQPVFAQVAQKLPEGSQKTVELLNESVTILQAMQKNFFIKGHVEEIKQEKAKLIEQQRLPASTQP
jgi:phospholipid/cholesterol/gamma-HCH transport system substrate-binding protein